MPANQRDASDELRELYETWLEAGKPEREPDEQ